MWYFFSRARAHTPGRSSKWKMTFNNCLRKSMSSLVSFFLNIVFSRRAMKNEYFKKLISNYFFIDYYFFYFLPKAAFLYLVTCNFYFVGDGLAFDWTGHLQFYSLTNLYLKLQICLLQQHETTPLLCHQLTCGLCQTTFEL